MDAIVISIIVKGFNFTIIYIVAYNYNFTFISHIASICTCIVKELATMITFSFICHMYSIDNVHIFTPEQ